MAVKKCTRSAKPSRIIGDPDNQRPDKWSSTVYLIVTKDHFLKQH